ncbi:RNB domain-containing ribonuclease [Undibacterium sp. LX40W]|uniref:RNB domain-containing ribonuclease n=1 Tax=Undibacterium nitidum TaxID=2762298 RepID=A0A923HZA3_9BURK|nr:MULTISPECIES: RNB domain-containing ribonuclease [Undibacterium]MBC3882986.1 RNB domain-containing ribonuclease [Undibacterium nitidum]MBC3893267.1 RNB domain-containing ribonuclease [Undibacterium sp. LX40W]
MNLFFEESGDFKAGSVLSQAGEAYQVELASGKRTKVKSKDVFLQFTSPDPASLLAQAKEVATQLDLGFLWEVAGQEEFGFAELGAEYFGATPQAHESAGLILALHSAPIYFQKKGRGRYKAAPEETLKAALAGIEKKKQQALVQAAYVEELKQYRLPEAFNGIGLQLLFKPDKNSISYKAMVEACNELQTTPAKLMLACGGLKNAKDFHLSKFLLEHFPKGVSFPSTALPSLPDNLPIADVRAFSIDDVTTTEIDDAFSITQIDADTVKVGIHIAAPALGISRNDAFDLMARQRMSTVYMPGDKITMLPDDLVNVYTLGEGQTRPAVSLYVTLNTNDWQMLSAETKVEAIPMSANLRHNDLDALVTEDNLAANAGEYAHKDDIAILWKWAQVLEAGRMAKRESFGLKPEQNNRVDFNFYVEDDVVSIVRRKRGAPLDKIVAELMILANSTWGKLLADHGIPGIYRAQGGGSGGWAAKMQVRMVTHAAPHQGLGVDQYAWSTSPLRRYTDLVNQWQIIACVQHGVTAALVAPFKPKDADLFAIVSGFDAAYAAYADFQTNMERYWCLRWLGQEQKRQVDAVVLKDEVLRLVEIPLIIRMAGMPQVARGAQVRLEILRWDELDLSVEARFLEALDTAVEEIGDELEELEEAESAESNNLVEPQSTEVAVVAPVEGEDLEQNANAEPVLDNGASEVQT